MLQELELKNQSLESQIQTLKAGNQEAMNKKYIELENKVFETERINVSLSKQVEQEKKKTEKVKEDFETVTTMIEESTSDVK